MKNEKNYPLLPMYKEWIVSADQWIQDYWVYRDGKLFSVEHDNKEATHREWEYPIDEFLKAYRSETKSPFPEMVEFLDGLK